MQDQLQDPQLSKKITPQTIKTKVGVVEYVEVGSGPAVIAIHGAMGGYDQSLILAQAIGAPGYRYLCLSRPGFLGTPFAAGKTPEAQGDLVAAFLDALELSQAGVMAISGGGPSAVQFGLRHPARCRGLVLVATVATPVQIPIPRSTKLMMVLARWPWFVNRYRRKAEQNLEAAAKRSIRDPAVLARTIQDQETWSLFSTLLLSTFDRMDRRLVGSKNDIEISRTATYPLEKLTVPVLIVHGTADRLAPFENARLYEQSVPNASLLVIEGGEHVAIFTHRKQIRETVSEFMTLHFAA
jgi:pimeloyl-ACP methyl ester carboxylesterase